MHLGSQTPRGAHAHHPGHRVGPSEIGALVSRHPEHAIRHAHCPRERTHESVTHGSAAAGTASGSVHAAARTVTNTQVVRTRLSLHEACRRPSTPPRAPQPSARGCRPSRRAIRSCAWRLGSPQASPSPCRPRAQLARRRRRHRADLTLHSGRACPAAHATLRYVVLLHSDQRVLVTR
jgi:hypothetical protein